MKRFNSEQVLALGPGDEVWSLLQASAVNLTECLRLFSEQPGVHFDQDESGVRFLNRNAPPDSMVLRMQPGGPADEQIDEELRRFETHGLPVDWMIFPPVGSTDIPLRLQERGLVQGHSRWLFAQLDRLPSSPSRPPILRIEAAESTDAMQAWRHASAAGFEWSDASATRYHDAYTTQPRTSENVTLRVHYVGYLNDAPVSTSTLILAGGIACIYDVSTSPEHRRKGYGTWLTRAALDEARRRGYRNASLMSSPLGYSVYRSLGFDLEFEIPEYRWTPGRTPGP